MQTKTNPMDFEKKVIEALCIFLLVLIFTKTILFFKSTSNRNFSRFFLFSTDSIYNSSSPEKIKAKILQNKLSKAIVVLSLFIAAVILIIYS